MTIKTFPIVLALAFAMTTACNNDAPQSAAPPTEEAAPTDGLTESAPAAAPAEGGAQVLAPLGTTPAATGQNPVGVAPAPAPQTSGAAPKVNPPHGQPGHVCGTPAGAATSGGTNPQPAAPQSVTLPPPGGGTGGTVAPGTNPPHGQPGHVCGTPVGTPLPKQ